MQKQKYSKHIQAALNKLEDEVAISGIIKVNDYGSMVEFVVNRWGDICTFRVEDNGEIYEK